MTDIVRLRKRGYYYRANWCGYTACKGEAGLYDWYEAQRHVDNTEGVSIELVPEYTK